MKLIERESAAYILAIRAEMPCYRTWLDDGAVCIAETTEDGPRRCPACEAKTAAPKGFNLSGYASVRR